MPGRGAAVQGYPDGVSRPSIQISPRDTRPPGVARRSARPTAAGKTPAFADGQIAAVASTNDLMVVTSNVADFAHFDDMRAEGRRG